MHPQFTVCDVQPKVKTSTNNPTYMVFQQDYGQLHAAYVKHMDSDALPSMPLLLLRLPHIYHEAR